MKKEKAVRIFKHLNSIERDLGIDDLSNDANDSETKPSTMEDYVDESNIKIKKIKNHLIDNKSKVNQKKINKKLKRISKIVIKELEWLNGVGLE